MFFLLGIACVHFSYRRSALVIIDDFHVKSVSVSPRETNTVLIVNSDTELALAVRMQSLKAIAWWNAKVVQMCRHMNQQKLAQRSWNQARREPL